jgi:hypothetical protein
MLGFSVRHTNSFSERMEGRNADLDGHIRRGNAQLLQALSTLHDAVDAGLAAEPAAAATLLDQGLAELGACNDHLTAIGDGLVRIRIELFERGNHDPADPLIAREACFPRLDYEAIYGELLAHGAALPQRLFWDDVASRVRDGGARAGLRLLDRHVRELQSDLRSLSGQVEVLRAQPLRAMAEALHTMSVASAAPVVGFVRLTTIFTYLSLVCERASQLHEVTQEAALERCEADEQHLAAAV